MSPNQLAFDRDLRRIADKADAGLLAPELVADSIASGREADGAPRSMTALDLCPSLEEPAGGLGSTLELGIVVIEVPRGVGGDEHPVVRDVQEASAFSTSTEQPLRWRPT